MTAATTENLLAISSKEVHVLLLLLFYSGCDSLAISVRNIWDRAINYLLKHQSHSHTWSPNHTPYKLIKATLKANYISSSQLPGCTRERERENAYFVRFLFFISFHFASGKHFFFDAKIFIFRRIQWNSYVALSPVRILSYAFGFVVFPRRDECKQMIWNKWIKIVTKIEIGFTVWVGNQFDL